MSGARVWNECLLFSSIRYAERQFSCFLRLSWWECRVLGVMELLDVCPELDQEQVCFDRPSNAMLCLVFTCTSTAKLLRGSSRSARQLLPIAGSTSSFSSFLMTSPMAHGVNAGALGEVVH